MQHCHRLRWAMADVVPIFGPWHGPNRANGAISEPILCGHKRVRSSGRMYILLARCLYLLPLLLLWARVVCGCVTDATRRPPCGSAKNLGPRGGGAPPKYALPGVGLQERPPTLQCSARGWVPCTANAEPHSNTYEGRVLHQLEWVHLFRS